MKWDIKELFNQFLHLETGFFLTYWVKYAFNILDYRLLFVGLTVGLLVEVYQYFYQDNRELHLPDRIRDDFFYIIGSGLIWLV